MKKFFLLSLSAVLFAMTSCSSDDNDTPGVHLQEMSYAGNLTVGSFEQPSVIDISPDNETKTLTLFINDAKFAPNMPLTIDITIKDIPFTVYGNNKINFQATNTDPYINTETSPAPNYRFATIQGEINEDNVLTLYAKMADDLAPYLAGQVFLFEGE